MEDDTYQIIQKLKDMVDEIDLYEIEIAAARERITQNRLVIKALKAETEKEKGN